MTTKHKAREVVNLSKQPLALDSPSISRTAASLAAPPPLFISHRVCFRQQTDRLGRRLGRRRWRRMHPTQYSNATIIARSESAERESSGFAQTSAGSKGICVPFRPLSRNGQRPGFVRPIISRDQTQLSGR